jgi:hypothetical protein
MRKKKRARSPQNTQWYVKADNLKVGEFKYVTRSIFQRTEEKGKDVGEVEVILQNGYEYAAVGGQEGMGGMWRLSAYIETKEPVALKDLVRAWSKTGSTIRLVEAQLQVPLLRHKESKEHTRVVYGNAAVSNCYSYSRECKTKQECYIGLHDLPEDVIMGILDFLPDIEVMLEAVRGKKKGATASEVVQNQSNCQHELDVNGQIGFIMACCGRVLLVAKRSKAERQGLRRGQVISEFDRYDPRKYTAEELRAIIPRIKICALLKRRATLVHTNPNVAY